MSRWNALTGDKKFNRDGQQTQVIGSIHLVNAIGDSGLYDR